MKSKSLNFLIIISVFLLVIFLVFFNMQPQDSFKGEKAYEFALYQVSLGPRIPGSQAHFETRAWITRQLESYDWDVEQQSCVDCASLPIHNIIAKRGHSNTWILIGAHYDSRIYADRDPNLINQTEPVPGANDGASGVGVLIELARVIPIDLDTQVWLVFFDAEDNGRIGTYDWILGSRYFVDRITDSATQLPDKVVVIDMIGDKDLNIFYERNSNQAISSEIWTVANNLGFDQFIPAPKYSIIDDHTPFLEAGIPAIDIIDFDYPYYHTLGDTPDKISPESLQVIGSTLYAWLAKTR
jgi:glutaminyl-peptide cyclotransferase